MANMTMQKQLGAAAATTAGGTIQQQQELQMTAINETQMNMSHFCAEVVILNTAKLARTKPNELEMDCHVESAACVGRVMKQK